MYFPQVSTPRLSRSAARYLLYVSPTPHPAFISLSIHSVSLFVFVIQVIGIPM
jgi:hypothetical protein